MKNNIILIGMPGSGKTTIGRILADKLGWSFIDTDDYIEKAENRCLQEIINKDGEDVFKKIEERVILELKLTRCVIATGGSVVLSAKAMEYLDSFGKIIFLDASLGIIKTRLRDNIDKRGIVGWKSQPSLDEVYNFRLPLYYKYASFTIIIDSDEYNKAADNIMEKLKVGWLSG